jgi:hypothetical protein
VGVPEARRKSSLLSERDIPCHLKPQTEVNGYGAYAVKSANMQTKEKLKGLFHLQIIFREKPASASGLMCLVFLSGQRDGLRGHGECSSTKVTTVQRRLLLFLAPARHVKDREE